MEASQWAVLAKVTSLITALQARLRVVAASKDGAATYTLNLELASRRLIAAFIDGRLSLAKNPVEPGAMLRQDSPTAYHFADLYVRPATKFVL